ncbi:LysR family transcriptional regulator [Methylobacterium iners]|uniref:HTH-type transcriptional regulator HdfR n=1 Tax=Methylobacterium iners TaxID=418707 RepID=A0ABQ4RZI7_9HYPH|nr:LysR family transcriptional regulator [Methylobacterium iners]GJD95578.1 HTH-type transcriptional regulator HdfR [Methylobacterium iners]
MARNWDDLRFFLAVARAGTLTAAAQQTRTEHTTVSRRIQALEKSLNRTLFSRSNLGYALTDAGVKLLATAEAMEGAFLGTSAMEDEATSIAGTVRIGAPDGLGSVFLAPRLHLLALRYPNIAVEILATARIFSLSRREADIAISLSSPKQSRLISRRLTDYTLFIYASEEYLGKFDPITNHKALISHPFVGYVEDMIFAKELNYLQEIGDNITCKFRSTNLLAQLYATLSGAGLCVLPHFIASLHPELVPILPERISLTRSFHMLIHEDHRNAAHIREVSSFIVDHIEKNKSLFVPHRR